MLTFIKDFLAKFFSNTPATTVVVVQPTVVEVPKTEAKPEVKTEVKPEVKTEVKPEVKPEEKTEAKPKKRYYKPKATAMSTPVKGKTQPKSDNQPAKVTRVKKSKPN
jgi:hypothetical protein